MHRAHLVVGLAVALLGCGDDSGPRPDLATLDGGKDGAISDAKAWDAPLADGKGVADHAAVTDKGQSSDGKTAKLLTSSHTGWKKTACATCHTLPPTGHTTSNTWECAKCHGGNGACDPNGSNSSKKNHAATMGCVTCHSQKHGFSTNTACASCHFAASGVDPSCP